MIKKIVTIYYYKVWNKRDFRLLPFLFSDSCKINYLNSPQTSIVTNPENIAAHIDKCFLIFPDLQFEVVNVVCNDQYVSAHCLLKYHGASENEYSHIEFLNMFKVSGGKICEQWIYTDIMDILIEHIGLVQTSASA